MNLKHPLKTPFIKIILLWLFLYPIVVPSSSAQTIVTPELVTYLASALNETSGLLNHNGEIWTHNDSGGEAELYEINTSTGDIIRTIKISNAENEDWEDISWDDTYIYIGDFGNNDGSRTDLKIYKVLRADIDNYDEVSAEIINFHYSDQTSFEPNYHNTNFDCEAMIHFDENLYLFTKNWLDAETNCYVLPNTAGTHEAALFSSFNTACLITGATTLPGNESLVLIGYNQNGGSYTWLFKGFEGDDFFNGENDQMIWTILSQIEGVCYADPNSIYISSEEFAGILEPALYYLDLSGFQTVLDDQYEAGVLIYTVHKEVILDISAGTPSTGIFSIYDLSGRLIEQINVLQNTIACIHLTESQGLFIAKYEAGSSSFCQKIFIR